MKSFFALTFCLALALSARADQDNHKKRNAEQRQTQSQPVQKQAVVRPGNRHGGAVGLQGSTGVQTTNPNLTTKQQRRLLKNQDGNLPGVQAGANAQIRAGKGNLRVKQFQTKNAPDPSIASEKFQPGKRIQNSEKWQGKQYSAFKTYQAQRHDRGWWKHHHTRIILIGGGWYFWDAGYWYPAWGYDDSYAYYPYDGPIYGANDLPPDQVIANVQAALQEQGYYEGEVDGFLGPLTRASLARYQADHGLYTTAAIDEPTLASLGLV